MRFPNIDIPSPDTDQISQLRNFEISSRRIQSLPSLDEVKFILDRCKGFENNLSRWKQHIANLSVVLPEVMQPIQQMVLKLDEIYMNSQNFKNLKQIVKELEKSVSEEIIWNCKAIRQLIEIIRIQIDAEKTYDFLPSIASLILGFDGLSQKIKTGLENKFSSIKIENLAELGDLASVFGQECQLQLAQCFVNNQLKAYQAEFHEEKNWNLDSINSRYDWITRLCENMETYNLPDAWSLRNILIGEFSHHVASELEIYLKTTNDPISHIVSLWILTVKREKEYLPIVSPVFSTRLENVVKSDSQMLIDVLKKADANLFFEAVKKSLERAQLIESQQLLIKLFEMYVKHISGLVKMGKLDTLVDIRSMTCSLFEHFMTIISHQYLHLVINLEEDIQKEISEQIRVQVQSLASRILSGFSKLNIQLRRASLKEPSEYIDDVEKIWKIAVNEISNLNQSLQVTVLVEMTKITVNFMHAQVSQSEKAKLSQKKTVTEQTANQLLLDTYAIRDIITSCSNTTSKVFFKEVNRNFTPLIAKLQILSAPDEKFLSSFLLFSPQLADTLKSPQLAESNDTEVQLRSLMKIRNFTQAAQDRILSMLGSHKN